MQAPCSICDRPAQFEAENRRTGRKVFICDADECKAKLGIRPTINHRGLIVVHVSGVPGSGKSTLGDKIIADLGVGGQVVVVDTDDLITHESEHGRELHALARIAQTGEVGWDTHKARWTAIFLGAIQDEIDRAAGTSKSQVKVIVFVGILDHFGPPDGSTLEITQATHRYFIDIPIADLLFQFYTRYYQLFKRGDPFWQEIADNRFTIPDSKTYVRDAATIKEWHRAHGYKVRTADAIFRRVARLVTVDNPVQMQSRIEGQTSTPFCRASGPIKIKAFEVQNGQYVRLVRADNDHPIDLMMQYIEVPNGNICGPSPSRTALDTLLKTPGTELWLECTNLRPKPYGGFCMTQQLEQGDGVLFLEKIGAMDSADRLEVNLWMVEQGWARYKDRKLWPNPLGDRYVLAEIRASKAKLGLWDDSRYPGAWDELEAKRKAVIDGTNLFVPLVQYDLEHPPPAM